MVNLTIQVSNVSSSEFCIRVVIGKTSGACSTDPANILGGEIVIYYNGFEKERIPSQYKGEFESCFDCPVDIENDIFQLYPTNNDGVSFLASRFRIRGIEYRIFTLGLYKRTYYW